MSDLLSSPSQQHKEEGAESCAGLKGLKRKTYHMQTMYILKIWLQRNQT